MRDGANDISDEIVSARMHEAIARIPWMLNVPALMVYEHGRKVEKLLPLTLDFVNDAAKPEIMVYITIDGNGEKELIELGRETDTFIFLPITVGEFSKHRKSYIGYRFTFVRGPLTIMQLLDNFDSAMIDVGITMLIHKFTYQTRGRSSIVIKHIYDIAHPPLKFHINERRDNFNETLVEHYHMILAGHCTHYMMWPDQ